MVPRQAHVGSRKRGIEQIAYQSELVAPLDTDCVFTSRVDSGLPRWYYGNLLQETRGGQKNDTPQFLEQPVGVARDDCNGGVHRKDRATEHHHPRWLWCNVRAASSNRSCVGNSPLFSGAYYRNPRFFGKRTEQFNGLDN